MHVDFMMFTFTHATRAGDDSRRQSQYRAYLFLLAIRL